MALTAPKIQHREFFGLAKEFISVETDRHIKENPESPPLSDVSSDDFISFIIRTKGARYNFHNIKKWSKEARKALTHTARVIFTNPTTATTAGDCENLMNRTLFPRKVIEAANGVDGAPQTESTSQQHDTPMSEQVVRDKSPSKRKWEEEKANHSESEALSTQTEPVSEQAADLDEPPSKRKRRMKKPNPSVAETVATVPASNLHDIPFIDRRAIDRLISVALACRIRCTSSELAGRSPSDQSASGCLILGPRGCGKTALVRAVAGDFGLPLLTASAFSFIGGPASGEALNRLFDQALEAAPSVLLLTQVEALPIHYSGKAQATANHLDTFLGCLRRCADRVVVLGETNSSLAQLNDTVKQVFPKSVTLGAMDLTARRTALRHLITSRGWNGRFNEELIEDLARRTPGFEVGDLARLLEELDVTAPMAAFHQLLFDEAGHRRPEPLDFDACAARFCQAPLNAPDIVDAALASVVPLARQKPGFVSVPSVTWEDVGALEEPKRELERFLTLVREPELAEQLCREAESLLLVGPPGCGKTMLAKAVSNEAGLNFISVKGPELLDKYQGESERHVREVFERARACPPCLIFFDELDALCARRGADSGDGRSSVVLQLLTEMDGLTPRGRVFVMGATNRLDIIDEAFLRRGRMGRVVHVGPPATAAAREAVLRALCRNGRRPRLEGDVADILGRVASDGRVADFSCAELRGILDEAKLAAQLAQRPHLVEEDLERGLEEVCRERRLRSTR